jgi:hypothetical protein
MTLAGFLGALEPLAESLGWQLQGFTRGDELVVIAALGGDPSFEQVVWISGTSGETLRCLLVSRAPIPRESREPILELCARINEGLVFGCAEYAFEEAAVVFRDAADLRGGSVEQLAPDTTARLLGLGSRYVPAVEAVLAGASPRDAVENAEADSKS